MKYAAISLFAVLFLAFGSGLAMAQSVAVKDAWIRGTVQGQSATGAFMELTGKSSARLVGADSPAAKTVEVHNMKIENGVMKMFPVDGIDVPAGKTVKLAPGGYHVMLMGLHKPLAEGQKVPLKLTFELANKKRETLDLNIEVRKVVAKPKMEGMGHHGH